MEEPLYILQQKQNDVEMEDDSFWEEVAKQVVLQETVATKKEDVDMDELLNTETPRFESLSVRDDEPPKTSLKRKRVGEDVFTRESVKQWQGSRIKAWENRYMVNNS